MALLRICTSASLRLPIPQRKRDTGTQSAKSRKVVKPGWPDVRSALDLAQARRLSCWSLDVRWRMNEVPQSRSELACTLNRHTQIGRAPVCTTVTNAQPVCRFPLHNTIYI